MLSCVYSPAVVAIVRKYISGLSMMSVRARSLTLCELVTDLDLVESHLLATGTPFSQLLQPAILDKIYGSVRRRSGDYSDLSDYSDLLYYSCSFVYTFF